MNQRAVPESKKKVVAELSNLIKSKKTLLIVSIKDLPASQFQEIGKSLREHAVIKVPKKNLIFMALDNSGSEEAKKLKEQINDSVAILFSDLDAFELSAQLMDKKKPAKAKIGQESPEDIEIPAGPTDLVPGPAISELGAMGIKIQIEGGKITIKEPKIIVKKNQKITAGAADLMNKLNIKPFSIGFVPVAAFDSQEGKLYLNIKIDREETLSQLREAFGRALPFAVQIGYICHDSIGFLIAKAERQSKAIERLMSSGSEAKPEIAESKTEITEAVAEAEAKPEENVQANKVEEITG
jgi:large subunit ribosomal protein L10